MNDMHSVALTSLVEEFSLEIAYKASDYEKIRVTVEDVSRPGMQLAGYFDHFEPMRLQLIGNVEHSYLQKLSEAERAMTYNRLLSYRPPALVIARNLRIDEQCIEMAHQSLLLQVM